MCCDFPQPRATEGNVRYLHLDPEIVPGLLLEPYLEAAPDLYPVSPVYWLQEVKARRISGASRAWIEANTRKGKAI
jgi:hypothetical protein